METLDFILNNASDWVLPEELYYMTIIVHLIEHEDQEENLDEEIAAKEAAKWVKGLD